MVEPVATSLINVGVALTSMLLNAAQHQQTAAIVTDARDPLTFLAQSLLGRRGTKKDIERRISKDLTSRMQDMNERCYSKGIDPERLANPCAEVEGILNAIDDHEQLLEQAVHDPDTVRAYFEQQAQNSRIQIDEQLLPYFDELIRAITDLYINYAERSRNYEKIALKGLMDYHRKASSERNKMQESIDAGSSILSHMEKKLDSLINNLQKPQTKRIEHTVWGSYPHHLQQSIERHPRCNGLTLQDTILNPPPGTPSANVLIGPTGIGKTFLAADIARKCEN